MNAPARVLLVEDERGLLRALAMNLVARGYEVTEAATGTAALAAAAADEHDVVVLDLGLPDVSGLDVIRALRSHSSTPVVVLSARSGSADKIEALDLGADDYVTKPFVVDELLARLRAVTRRTAAVDDGVVARIGEVTVDLRMTTATRDDGEAVHLTPTEWKLLDVLLRRPGRLVSGEALLTAVRGSAEHTDPSYLRIYVAQLRRKLEREPARPRHLVTEPGMGYRFRP
ncbi:two-component system, OmpR family, KDP operon response regulator KdpE [Jatrophihabitans endophyticus]|uniref:Two-component system, OmpR family, KDP operon response regulator KdpE n=1 Tax=Jatrophihabitans endophyticus TaxID=1206085 RepID=A0A1M5DUJ6_9ACTN|nr:response regulator [Jatrophihabitans endophyticus]SHF70683.1 two-component system, OmpR family, KDP operon response regulator KdpE [Jatrophihabitans endophyticus]